MDYLFGLHFVFRGCSYEKAALIGSPQRGGIGRAGVIMETALFTGACSLDHEIHRKPWKQSISNLRGDGSQIIREGGRKKKRTVGKKEEQIMGFNIWKFVAFLSRRLFLVASCHFWKKEKVQYLREVTIPCWRYQTVGSQQLFLQGDVC